MSGITEPAGNEGQVSFTIHSNVRDILQAAEVVDKKNRTEVRRGIQTMGVVVVLWMFIPDVIENPTSILSWMMILLAVGLLGVLWKYPDYANQKFAASKVKISPEYHFVVTRDRMEVTEGEAHGTVSFSESIAVFEYKNVFAVSYDKNRLLTISKDQLDEQTLEKLRGLLHEGLGDRFEKVEEFTKQAGLFGRGK